MIPPIPDSNDNDNVDTKRKPLQVKDWTANQQLKHNGQHSSRSADNANETTHLLRNSTKTETAGGLKNQPLRVYLVACLSAIGGFLFGYDTGIVSGAMLFIKAEFKLNDVWQEAIVSSTLLTAWLFSILSGSANDLFGRKPVILASSVVFAIGSILLAIATNKWLLVAGRLIVGAGVGISSMTAPMYIAELSPASCRGHLLHIYMSCITGGQFIAAVVAFALSYTPAALGWRLMLGIAALPAFVQLVAFAALPESPRWLVGQRRFGEAIEVLRALRNNNDEEINAEFTAICSSSVKAEREESELLASIDLANQQAAAAATTINTTNENNINDDELEASSLLSSTPSLSIGVRPRIERRRSSIAANGQNATTIPIQSSNNNNNASNSRRRDSASTNHVSTFRRILANESCARALVVGCALQLTQQLSAINTIMYYSASIIEMSGVRSKQMALLLSGATALVNFVGTLVGFMFVERSGRRRLVLVSLAGVTVALVLLGAGFQLDAVNSPKITQADNSPLNKPCNSYSSCAQCISDRDCGFCFNDLSSQNQVERIGASICYHVDAYSRKHSQLGFCASNATKTTTTFANTTANQNNSNHQFVFAYEWCPSKYSYLIVIAMLIYLSFFSPGMGPMPWTINSEIYPSWARSWCLSAATSVVWLSNLAVSMTFLTLARVLTNYGAFYLYASFSFIGFVFFFWCLPETRGKSLEELETLFASKQQNQQEQQSSLQANRSDSNSKIEDCEQAIQNSGPAHSAAL